MQQKTSLNFSDVDNHELATRCLGLIGEIASRGANSRDPGVIGHALQELSQVLLEQIGAEEILFEPIPIGQIGELSKLYEELDFVNCASQDLVASASPRAN